MTLARGLLVCLGLILLAGAVGVWVGVPYLERRWTYRVVKETPDAPWQTPKGAEKVTFLAADDVRLRGWFFPAAARPNGMTVLVLPGNYGNLPGYVSHCRYLQQRGFNLLLFNYRGFGMSEGDTKSEATLTLDGEAAMQYLASKRGIAADDVVIAGISLGQSIRCRGLDRPGALSCRRDPWRGRRRRSACPGKAGLRRGRPPKHFIEVPTADHGLMGVPPESYLDALTSFLVEGR